jgi:hypothetical protein
MPGTVGVVPGPAEGRTRVPGMTENETHGASGEPSFFAVSTIQPR